MSKPERSEAEAVSEALAVTLVGEVAIAIEAARVDRFHDAAGREADADLNQLLGLPPPEAGGARLVELAHAGGTLLLAVHGSLRLTGPEQQARCHCPALIAGVLRRSCLQGVLHHQSRLVFLLDVDQIASRLDHARKEQAPCPSD